MPSIVCVKGMLSGVHVKVYVMTEKTVAAVSENDVNNYIWPWLHLR